MADAKEQAQAQPAATTQEGGLLDKVIKETRAGRDDESREQAKREISTLVQEVMQGTLRYSKNLESSINARIANLDVLISKQLNEIMHNAEFQKLEGSWRGLRFLVMSSETSPMLKIKVFNSTKEELRRDLEKASEFDQSMMFKKVYEEEFGTFGGAPFGALIGDYEFGRAPQDIAMLEGVASVASSAHAPFFSAADPTLFNIDSYTDIGNPRDLSKIFDTVEYAKYKSFRESEDSRFVGLTLPHVLMRLPYGPDTVPVEAFNFKEDVDGTDHRKYLWGNAAYSLGTRITAAFAKYGWCAAIRGSKAAAWSRAFPPTPSAPTRARSR